MAKASAPPRSKIRPFDLIRSSVYAASVLRRVKQATKPPNGWFQHKSLLFIRKRFPRLSKQSLTVTLKCLLVRDLKGFESD